MHGWEAHAATLPKQAASPKERLAQTLLALQAAVSVAVSSATAAQQQQQISEGLETNLCSRGRER